ncbi:MAG: [FeFe] hydrogenase H-cluster radical SAM maturase HydE [Syntrophomonadaceae bacterium]|nr:[FeFe] hydrogenase H-cluster radical SAM maturase HydE [Syntrophomonadaceae bacterium]
MRYYQLLQNPDQDVVQQQLNTLLADDRPEVLEELRREADQVRWRWVGDKVHVRGIIEFSNYCIRSCHYCGLNRTNTRIQRYRIPLDEIVEVAREAVAMGLKTIVLQSGDDFYYTREMIADIVREIKATGAAVTLSVGERPAEDYRAWREAGADRYLLKFETSDPGLYKRLHPGTSLDIRLRCLRDLRELGYQVGSGFMIGLPGQTTEILARDLMLMRTLHLEMAGIGPFIPHPATPLSQAPAGDVTLSLKALALSRLLLPWAHLPATTALSSLDTDGRRLGLTGGANVVMPNITPPEYRRLYEIYPHKAEVKDSPQELYRATLKLIRELGREVADDPGHALSAEKISSIYKEEFVYDCNQLYQ